MLVILVDSLTAILCVSGFVMILIMVPSAVRRIRERLKSTPGRRLARYWLGGGCNGALGIGPSLVTVWFQIWLAVDAGCSLIRGRSQAQGGGRRLNYKSTRCHENGFAATKKRFLGLCRRHKTSGRVSVGVSCVGSQVVLSLGFVLWVLDLCSPVQDGKLDGAAVQAAGAGWKLVARRMM